MRKNVNTPKKFKDHPLFNELVVGMNYNFMAKKCIISSVGKGRKKVSV